MSAWSKPGGVEPLCFEGDIPDEIFSGIGRKRKNS